MKAHLLMLRKAPQTGTHTAAGRMISVMGRLRAGRLVTGEDRRENSEMTKKTTTKPAAKKAVRNVAGRKAPVAEKPAAKKAVKPARATSAKAKPVARQAKRATSKRR